MEVERPANAQYDDDNLPNLFRSRSSLGALFAMKGIAGLPYLSVGYLLV